MVVIKFKFKYFVKNVSSANIGPNHLLLLTQLKMKIKDWFDQEHNPSHLTLYPDIFKIKTIILV